MVRLHEGEQWQTRENPFGAFCALLRWVDDFFQR